MGMKRTRRPLVKDQPGFEKHMVERLNPELDFTTLTTGSNKKIRYIDDSGQISRKKINNMMRSHNPYAPANRAKFVKDMPGFKEHKVEELNPELDFATLTTRSEIKIRYVDDSGQISCRRVDGMTRSHNPYAHINRLRLVKDMPGFKEHRVEELNPELDFATLTAGANKKIRFTDDGGRIQCRIAKRMDWENNPYAPTIRSCLDTEDPMATVGKDKYFWSHCAEEESDVIKRIRNVKRSSRKVYNMVCDRGHYFRTSVKRFYKLPLEEACPYCSGRKILPGVNDAKTIDPDLAIFYSASNPKPVWTISPYTCKRYIWECPHCGYTFSKAIKNLVGKNPKCPQCKDIGQAHMHQRSGDDFFPYLSLE